MAELLDYLPLFQEDATSIRARLDADVNAGLTSDDLRWIDTREGTFYWVVTQPVVIELARLWDALSLEVPASAFPLFAWGDYLDRHAEVFGLVRKDPVAAGGEVVFTGDPGTLVATGTTVSSDPATEDDEGQEFLTTVSGVIGDRLLTPSAPSATPSGTGGTLPAGTHYYRVTAVNEFGETVGSPENSAVTTGTTSKVTLDWPDVPGATGYRVYRSDVSGQDGVRLYDAAASTFIDTGLTSGIVGPPSVDSSGGVSLLVEATEEGEDGNVGALAITNLDSPNPGIDAVYNPTEMSGGTEEETDEELRQRILFEFEGQGGCHVLVGYAGELRNPDDHFAARQQHRGGYVRDALLLQFTLVFGTPLSRGPGTEIANREGCRIGRSEGANAGHRDAQMGSLYFDTDRGAKQRQLAPERRGLKGGRGVVGGARWGSGFGFSRGHTT